MNLVGIEVMATHSYSGTDEPPDENLQLSVSGLTGLVSFRTLLASDGRLAVESSDF